MDEKKLKKALGETLLELILPRFDQMDKRIDEYHNEVIKYKNDLLDRTDQVYAEVKAMWEEQAAHQIQHRDANDRFEAIESVPAVAHELKKKKN